MFERNGFELLSARGNGLLYSGYALLPRLSLARRRALAPFLRFVLPPLPRATVLSALGLRA